jgi:hypothetical protein
VAGAVTIDPGSLLRGKIQKINLAVGEKNSPEIAFLSVNLYREDGAPVGVLLFTTDFQTADSRRIRELFSVPKLNRDL